MNEIILPDFPGIVDRSSIRDDRHRRLGEACRGDDHVPRHATRDSLGLHDSQEDPGSGRRQGGKVSCPLHNRPSPPATLHSPLSYARLPVENGRSCYSRFLENPFTIFPAPCRRRRPPSGIPCISYCIELVPFPPCRGGSREEGESGGSG